MRYLQQPLKRKTLLVGPFLFFASTLLFSCSNAQNDKDAFIVATNGHYYIKLSGKRKLMAHDPFSLLKGETYKDSCLIEIPSVKNGITEGKNIPVRKGNYQYSGNLIIKDHQLKVNLFIDDTDDNRLRPLSWNGEYNLKVSY